MNPDAVEGYVARLERELRRRGVDDPRILDEAREHLVDAVEDARRRGLSIDDAVRDAFARFGAPETVAAAAAAERNRMIARAAALLDTVWRRKWWILAPTAATAVVTSVLTAFLLPTRYRSEAVISVVAQLVSDDVVRAAATEPSGARLQAISQRVLSRRRLERAIDDLGLYRAEREQVPLENLVARMRRDIAVDVFGPRSMLDGDRGGFKVSFVASEPRTAMRVTERLASMFVEENLRDREVRTEGTHQFLDGEIDNVRERLRRSEEALDRLRQQNRGRPLSQVDLMPHEVLLERYRDLLVKSEESRTAARIERRQIGEQFKVVDAAELPEHPVGPNRRTVTVAGAAAGLGVGVVLALVNRRKEEGPAV